MASNGDRLTPVAVSLFAFGARRVSAQSRALDLGADSIGGEAQRTDGQFAADIFWMSRATGMRDPVNVPIGSRTPAASTPMRQHHTQPPNAGCQHVAGVEYDATSENVSLVDVLVTMTPIVLSWSPTRLTVRVQVPLVDVHPL